MRVLPIALLLFSTLQSYGQTRNETLQFLFLDGEVETYSNPPFNKMFDSNMEIQTSNDNGEIIRLIKYSLEKGQRDGRRSISEVVILDNCKIIYNSYDLYKGQQLPLSVGSHLIFLDSVSNVRKPNFSSVTVLVTLTLEGSKIVSKFKGPGPETGPIKPPTTEAMFNDKKSYSVTSDRFVGIMVQSTPSNPPQQVYERVVRAWNHYNQNFCRGRAF